MSQRAKRRSLSVPGSRPARSNPGLPVPTSVSNRSNPSPGDSAFRPHALHRQIHDPACSESPRVVGHCSLQGTGPKRCFEPKVVMQAGQARASPPRSSINSISSIDRRRSATYRSGVDSFSAWACWTLVALFGSAAIVKLASPGLSRFLAIIELGLAGLLWCGDSGAQWPVRQGSRPTRREICARLSARERGSPRGNGRCSLLLRLSHRSHRSGIGRPV